MVRAQDTGWITGSVADPTGAMVSKATVNLILHGGSKPVATTVTTAQGLFTLQTLRPVYYDLTVDAPGFQQYKLDNVKVDPSRPTDLPRIVLKVAAVATSVTTTAGLETVQTTSPELSTTVTAEQIERLPVGDRNPLGFISTQSGVSPGLANGYETDINGQRSSFSNVTLDGMNIQDNYIRTGDLDYTPNEPLLSQVQEFTVVSSNQGTASSGGASQVNFTTPSGTNQFHGSVFWQNRNNKFAANDFFDNSDGNPLPRLNLNQAGVSVGGPIKKDKLFFYTTYELYRLKSQAEADATILTSTARQGIFSWITPSGQVQQTNILNIVDLPMDPLMSQLLAQVPDASHINNIRVGDSVPGQLLNTAGYGYLVRDNQERDNAEGKMDYYINSTNSITATYAWNRDRVDRPDVGLDYSTIPPFQNDDSRNLLTAAWRANPRPTLTNEVRAGANIAPATFGYTGSGGPLPSYLIGGMDYTSPQAYENSSILAQGRNTRTYSIQDNATWTHGRHTIKFGAFYQADYVRTYDYTGTIPAYNVGISSTNQSGNLLFQSDLPTASALQLNGANLLLASLAGLIDDDGQTFNVTSQSSGFVPGAPYLRHLTYDNLAFYGQDEWKLRPRLTLTAGLRWEYDSPVNERDSLELQPLVTGTAQQTLLSDATLYYTGNSVDRPFYRKDLNNFAPNIGLAWDPFGKGKTSVRAGYSISYVNDEAITVAEAFTDTNPGLVYPVANFNLSGFMSTDRMPIATPTFQVPLTFDQGYAQNPEVYYGLIDPNLRTPYVQMWNFTIQHEIKGTIIQAGYVANHATKLLRGFDYNQEVVPANFLSDFLKAQQNGFLAEKLTGSFNPAYNRSIPGSQPLPVFNQIPDGGFLSNGSVQSDIETGQVADLGALYQINGLVGANSGPFGGDTALNFFPNPNALGSTLVTNFSNSTFNSLQLEARHRFGQGLEFQANFTWEKWLSDAAGIFQNRFEPFMDINNTAIERARTPTDLTYQFKGNYSYDLPLGQGHRFGSGRILSRIVGGWMTSGNVTWVSGPPFGIISGLGTFLSGPDSGNNTAIALENMSQLDSQIKFRMTGNGPYVVPASAIGSDGRGVAPPGSAPFTGQLFYNPGPDQLGTLQKRIFDGPPIFNYDAKLAKSIKFSERINSQLFMEALNVFNHPNWFVGDQNINSPLFGKVTSTALFNPRQLQLGLKVSF